MSAKPTLLIGLDPNMNKDAVATVVEQLREVFSDYYVVVIGGLRYSAVLERGANR